MGFEMSPTNLKKLCREKRLYASLPELNEVLHLHHKGIVEIKGLDSYTGLKTLHLECNAICRIQNLDCLVNLRCLHLNENLLEDVDGLDKLPRLESLDLADNQIKCVKGLSCCTNLRQLNLSGNMLCRDDEVAPLTMCKNLQSLDISRNKIDNTESLELIQSLPLMLLKMLGNPIVSTTQNYRKLCIVGMPSLKYLDDSPVANNERRLAAAWINGGIEEEQSMREKIRKEEADQRHVHRQAFEAMIEAATAELAERDRKQREAAAREEEDRAREQKRLAEMAAEEEHRLAEMAAKEKELIELAAGEEEKSSRIEQFAALERERIAELAASEVERNLSGEEMMEQVECAEKEKRFKKEVQERILERTAAAFASRDGEVQAGECERPMVWGTKAYKALWEMAATVIEHPEI